jgi:hypothetical protein
MDWDEIDLEEEEGGSSSCIGVPSACCDLDLTSLPASENESSMSRGRGGGVYMWTAV